MNAYAGIDVGSLSADAVIVDEDGRLLGLAVTRTGHDSRAAGAAVYEAALQAAGLKEDDIASVVSTGYSRKRIEAAGTAKTEISCHARGAFAFFDDVSTVIDVGGQDSKAIRVGPGGQVLDFAMNDKCAAGTGRFLEVMAGVLSVELGELAGLAGDARTSVTISSTCTVFGESEVVGLISQGAAPADIAAAVSRAIARRVAGLARGMGAGDGLSPVSARSAGGAAKGRVVMTGGVALNAAVVASLSRELDVEISVPEHPQHAGALGAALFARDGARRAGSAS